MGWRWWRSRTSQGPPGGRQGKRGGEELLAELGCEELVEKGWWAEEPALEGQGRGHQRAQQGAEQNAALAGSTLCVCKWTGSELSFILSLSYSSPVNQFISLSAADISLSGGCCLVLGGAVGWSDSCFQALIGISMMFCFSFLSYGIPLPSPSSPPSAGSQRRRQTVL